ncbi:hypothetical protein [Bradyrhizobium sp. SZCCHNRI3052]|uniref:hypothetical protein n=1 Tax=Bradyrhizobium sp. SZCCHNRI3052 TaxID=3057295 RepID=UPI00291635E0|nr:hypothetical protein [Bradyrhizobium sp. SZCCHNRI3052]
MFRHLIDVDQGNSGAILHESAQDEWMTWNTKYSERGLSATERTSRQDKVRSAFHVMTIARHDMLSAGAQFFVTRNWAVLRKLVDERIFSTIDAFQSDVAILRNMHQHQIEYFKGKGQKPDQWRFMGEAWIADAVSTVDGLWGGRLDAQKFSEEADKLLPALVPLDPLMIDRQKMFARIEIRGLKYSEFGRKITEEDIDTVAQKVGLSSEIVKEEAAEVEAENKPLPVASG